MKYKIQIVVSRMMKRGMVSKKLPMFLLDSLAQKAMTAEHAARIATKVFLPFSMQGVEKISIHAEAENDGDACFLSLDPQRIADLLEQQNL